MFVFSRPGNEVLMIGSRAPAFELYDQTGQRHCLSDYAGEWLVVYFYPKDDTPGCTREACEFRDDYAKLRHMGVILLGVSLDNEASHRAFAQKHSLPFPLLSDRKGRVAADYGALWKLGPIRFARRQTFIIDPEGCIARIFRKVEPLRHSDEIISALRSAGIDVRDSGEGVDGE